jgi:poly-gamma-glutamate capsule biosynthesis protein CapA/YwtB (metallophosphatase superfamily)
MQLLIHCTPKSCFSKAAPRFPDVRVLAYTTIVMKRRPAILMLPMAILIASCGRIPPRDTSGRSMTYAIVLNPGANPALVAAVFPALERVVDSTAIGRGLVRLAGDDASTGNPSVVVSIDMRIDSSTVQTGDDDSMLSFFFLVPVTGFDAGVTDTSMRACLSGNVALAPMDAIPEGHTAMFVDGLAVDDAGYPLVACAGITVRGTNRRAAVQSAELSGLLRFALAHAKAAPEMLWMAAAGDMMLGRGAGERLVQRGAADLMGGAATILAKADIAVVNLEGAITNRGLQAAKAYTFRFDPAVAPVLAAAGIDAVLVSNNHALDWGATGFADTMGALKGAGIGALGGGADLAEAAAPHQLKGARLYGLSSYPRENSGWDGASHAATDSTGGIMRAEAGGVTRLASGFRKGVVDAVFLHGGSEWSATPDPSTVLLGHALIDAGADAVFGSHPHVVQRVELYRGKIIFWSLGNFVFQGMQGTPGGEKGILALVGFHGERAVYVRSIPVSLEGTGVDLAPGP